MMDALPTELLLREWRDGQTQSERLSAALLHLEGFEGVDPQAPLGGSDGKKDILFRRGGYTWIAACYFPPTAKQFSEVRAKFQSDLNGVSANGATGLAFFCNQRLTLTERDELIALADGIAVELYHLERMRSLLDSPRGYGIRLEFLRIAMSKEEQIAFWSTMNQDVNRRLLDNERILSRMDAKLDNLQRTMLLALDQRGQTSSIVTVSDSLEAPMGHLTADMILWIHRILTEHDNIPESVRGRFRAVNVWIGTRDSTPQTATHTPPPPEEIPYRLAELLAWWKERHIAARSMSKEEVAWSLAELHWRFLYLHPFLDANGRVARVLLDQAARELLSLKIGSEFVGDSQAYYQALAAADRGDLSSLRRLVLASLN